MKKAVAYIDSRAIIELLKVPHNVKLTGIEFPSKNDKMKIVIEGDSLPVKRSGPKTKRLPEVVYTVLRHWHSAKIAPKTKELNDETQERNASISV
jgi:hypothetical protein